MPNKELEDLIEVLMKMKSTAQMRDFLEGILSPKELKEIPTRLKIVRMLKKGIAQHQIAEELNVGVATVTRGSKELKKGRFKDI